MGVMTKDCCMHCNELDESFSIKVRTLVTRALATAKSAHECHRAKASSIVLAS